MGFVFASADRAHALRLSIASLGASRAFLALAPAGFAGWTDHIADEKSQFQNSRCGFRVPLGPVG
jgi:hypothetical protein